MRDLISDETARAMYAGGRANRSARRFARVWGYVFASGVGPRRWVRLEVPGRRTGRTQRIPIGLADVHGRWYAVSMLGECNWVRNLRANANGAVLRHGAAKTCVLVEVPGANRPAILRRYLEVAPGGRPHIPATAASSTTDLVAIADAFPVFAIQRADGRPYCPTRSWFPVAAIASAVSVFAACVSSRR